MGTVMISKIEGSGEELPFDWSALGNHLQILSSGNVKYDQVGNKITASYNESKESKPPTNYPYIEKISLFGEPKPNACLIAKEIGEHTHNARKAYGNGSDFLGSAKSRFSSSLMLSSVKVV